MHPIYMALTVGEGIYRANNIASYKSLWVNSTFLALVYLQKAGKLSLLVPDFCFFVGIFSRK